MITDLNRQLARIFREMSAMYTYIGNTERFRALAYQHAAQAISGLTQDVTRYVESGTLEDIPGIGEHTADKIKEYIHTGKIEKYEVLKKSVPLELLDMIDIRGFGPQSLKAIHENLHAQTQEEVISLLVDGSIAKLKGFGKAKVDNMLRGLKLHKVVEERMLLWDALRYGEKVKSRLMSIPQVIHIELAGSLRRKKETIGDIDVLVSCKLEDRKKMLTAFTTSTDVKTRLASGLSKASILLKETNRQVDLRVVNEEEWGAALLYFTGSKEHNIHLRSIAKERGLKINEYGVFRMSDDKRLGGKTEQEVYELLGFQWIPPEMREDTGELELSERKKIPELIQLNDIRGDLHIHSNSSDGLNSVEELARYVLENRRYEYIALTDHSKSERIAGGMDEAGFLKQVQEIRAVTKKLGKDVVKSGAEVDILSDGSLDLTNELLSQLDWVCASIHSGFTKDITERIIQACENPFVCCIGHPTGRLIGKRQACKVDWKRVFKAARETGTALEINAQPERMDVNDALAREAKNAGVKLVIATDSHATAHFDYMELGVFIAQRAWCTSSDILNSGSWNDIVQFRKYKRKRMGYLNNKIAF